MPERPPAPPDECANCGTAIPPGAKACPECGADEHTGWRETSVYDEADLPDEAYDEGGRGGPSGQRGQRVERRVNGVPWYWWSVGLALIVLLALGALALA